MKLTKLKSIFCVLLAAFMLMTTTACSSSSDEENSITVFSWEDYIDEDLLTEFEEETGIKVNYYTFATNEEMYNELIKSPSACDLICPSEYMIMKMVDEGLVQKYEAPQSYQDFGSPYIKSVFDSIEVGDGDKLSDYAIGYMWGTMGYIYNSDTVNPDDIKNWDGIINDAYKGKCTIKDSVRDTYIMALAMVYKDELLGYKDTITDPDEYNAKLTEVFNRIDDESIAKVKDVLIKTKPYLYSFEVDSGKSDLLTGKIDINFAWSGDAVYALDLGEEAGKNLSYIVPEEGSNVWFDGWVIPKASQKSDRARDFLGFISKPENAVRNMDYIGYTSCVGVGVDSGTGDFDGNVFDTIQDWYGAFTLSELTEAEYNALSEEEKENCEKDNDGKFYEYVDITEFYTLQLTTMTEDDYEALSDDDKADYELMKDGKVYEYVNKDTATGDSKGLFAVIASIDDGCFAEKMTELFEVDLKYFFEPDCDDDSYVILSKEEGRQLYAQYFDEETINRCVVMKNFDKETLNKINKMWNDVKLIILPNYLIVILAAAIVVVMAAVVVVKLKKPEFLKVKKDDKK